MLLRSKKTIPPKADDAFSRQQALACVPVRNPQIKEHENEQGELCLAYQVRIKPWFQNIVQKFTGKSNEIIERKLQLDGLGSSVWHMINGKRSVKELITEFQNTHQLNPREAEISITAFLKDLGKRGLIVMRDNQG